MNKKRGPQCRCVCIASVDVHITTIVTLMNRLKTTGMSIIRMKTSWLACNKVRPCPIRLNWLLFSSKQQRRAKQLSETRKTSKWEKREVFDWLHAVLWRIDLSPIYTTWLLSLYNSLNRLLFPYNSTCNLYGLDLYLFELITWSYSDSNSTWSPPQLGFQLNQIPHPWTLLGSDVAYPSLDSSLLELKVLIHFSTWTPSQFGLVF
jgi:hypothetical protein